MEFSSFLSVLLAWATENIVFSGFGTRWLKYDTWLILYVPMPPGRMCSTEGGGAGGGGFSIVKISTLVSSLAVALLTCSSGCRKSCVWRKPPVQAWKDGRFPVQIWPWLMDLFWLRFLKVCNTLKFTIELVLASGVMIYN